MGIDTTPSTVATNALTSIPFSAIIGGPLDAAIRAQAMAAQTSWDFIKNVGLTTDPNTGETKAVSVNFQYQKDGQMVNLVVPLLAIVPIPFIAIDTITIDFTAKIDASASTFDEQSNETEGHLSGSADLSVGWGPFSAKMHMEGGFSSKSMSKGTQESKYSVEYTINIHVEAGQDSMPAGLATVLNILNSAITEGNPSGTFTVSPNSTQLQVGVPNGVAQISVKSRDSSDLGVTDNVTFTYKAKTGATVNYADLALTVITGTIDTSQPVTDGIAVRPTDQGIAVVQVAFASNNGTGLNLAAAELDNFAIAQVVPTSPTPNSATTSITFLPPAP